MSLALMAKFDALRKIVEEQQKRIESLEQRIKKIEDRKPGRPKNDDRIRTP